MFVNSINSDDFRHVQNFLFSFLVQQCAFNAEVTFPPLFHTPSKVNIRGVQLFSHYLLGWHVMFPDTIFTLKDSRIVTASQFSGSRIEMDIEFQLTKVSHIPIELWIPPIDRMILLYQAKTLQDMLYAVHCPIITPSTEAYTGYSNYYQAPQHMFSSNSLDSYITTSDMIYNQIQQRATKKVSNSNDGVNSTTTNTTATGTELQESENVGESDRVSQRSKTAVSSTDRDLVMGSDRLIALSPPTTTATTTPTTTTTTTTADITSSNTSTATSTSRAVFYGDSTISVLSTTSTGNSTGSLSQLYAPPAGTNTAAQAAISNPFTAAQYIPSQLSHALSPAYFQYSGGGTSSAPDKAESTASYTALHSHLPAAEAQDFAAATACSTSATDDPVGMGLHNLSPVLPAQARIPDRFVNDLHAAAVLLHSPLPLRLVGQYVLYLDESNHIVHITLSAAPVQPSPTT